MTRQFPHRVSNVGNNLARVAGSYLHSVTAGDWSACEVCALPIDAVYTLCVQCLNHQRSGLPLADRAGFLVYADEPLSQTYRTMRGYKEPLTRAVFEPIVQALLAVGLRGHFVCANKLAGMARPRCRHRRRLGLGRELPVPRRETRPASRRYRS